MFGGINGSSVGMITEAFSSDDSADCFAGFYIKQIVTGGHRWTQVDTGILCALGEVR